MSNDEQLPETIITDFPISNDSSPSDSSGFEFLASVALEALEKDIDSSTATIKSIWRGREKVSNKLMSNYFVDEPTFDDVFRLRYQMSKPLFLKIVADITAKFEWFREGADAANQKSFMPIQKCTCALRQLAYSNLADNYDEGLGLYTRTAREYLDFFCNAIIQLYGEEYLRSSTSHDIAGLYEAHEARHHFPGMIGSIDCTHWVWRNRPTSLRGQYHRGDNQYPTINLEAVASQDLWFWHALFGLAGSNNDINVIMQSPLFTPEMHGNGPELGFNVNGHQYRRGYYLSDGIYPAWSCFLKAYAYPIVHKEKVLKRLQEAMKKDVERAFRVLKNKWIILVRPARMNKKQKIINTIYACVILHNMVIKDDGHTISLQTFLMSTLISTENYVTKRRITHCVKILRSISRA